MNVSDGVRRAVFIIETDDGRRIVFPFDPASLLTFSTENVYDESRPWNAPPLSTLLKIEGTAFPSRPFEDPMPEVAEQRMITDTPHPTE